MNIVWNLGVYKYRVRNQIVNRGYFETEYRGYDYICNIVDCYMYSRLAFGACWKQKTAKEMSDTLIFLIYFLIGPPSILQSEKNSITYI